MPRADVLAAVADVVQQDQHPPVGQQAAVQGGLGIRVGWDARRRHPEGYAE